VDELIVPIVQSAVVFLWLPTETLTCLLNMQLPQCKIKLF